MPNDEAMMRQNIEQAYTSRTTKADSIINPNEMMKYNGTCKVCNLNHGA